MRAAPSRLEKAKVGDAGGALACGGAAEGMTGKDTIAVSQASEAAGLKTTMHAGAQWSL